MTKAAKFTSYEEAHAWIEAGQAQYGKRAFTARPEYAAAYAQIAALHKQDHPTYKRANRKAATRIGGHVNLLAYAINN